MVQWKESLKLEMKGQLTACAETLNMQIECNEHSGHRFNKINECKLPLINLSQPTEVSILRYLLLFVGKSRKSVTIFFFLFLESHHRLQKRGDNFFHPHPPRLVDRQKFLLVSIAWVLSQGRIHETIEAAVSNKWHIRQVYLQNVFQIQVEHRTCEPGRCFVSSLDF